MDTGTALTVLGGAIGGAKVVEKLLGPTADYIGVGVKNWTEKRVNNVSRIFSAATRRLGAKIEEQGSVPPKILKGILDEGSFCDDELAAEYFGGVLASSRTEIPRDDRGAAYIATISRLSTYQIRSHYIFYQMVKNLYDGLDIDLGFDSERAKVETIIPIEIYKEALDLSDKEDVFLITNHAISGLVRELLIEERPGLGGGRLLTEPAQRIVLEGLGTAKFSAKDGGISTKYSIGVRPTIPGIEMFLWVHGRSNWNYQEFFKKEKQFELISNIHIPKGYHQVRYAASHPDPERPSG